MKQTQDIKIEVLQKIKDTTKDIAHLDSDSIEIEGYSKNEVAKTIKQFFKGDYIIGLDVTSYNNPFGQFLINSLSVEGEKYLELLKSDYDEHTLKGWVKKNIIAILALIISLISLIVSIFKSFR